jgi:hypothetical protein
VTRRWLAITALCALAAGATCARSKPPAPAAPRINDSPPEQRAALNAAARLGLEAEDERWGIEAAKERKRQEAARAESRNRTVVVPMPPPNDSGVLIPRDGGFDGSK